MDFLTVFSPAGMFDLLQHTAGSSLYLGARALAFPGDCEQLAHRDVALHPHIPLAPSRVPTPSKYSLTMS